MPQCARVKCRKLFHGVRMQGYQCVQKPRIFVHYECLKAVIGGEEVVEVPEEGINSKQIARIVICANIDKHLLTIYINTL